MNFSTKAMEEITALIAEEIGNHLDTEEIKNLETLENGIREIMKEIGQKTYGQVLEREDEKLGKSVRCACRRHAKRISKREAKILTVFGWISYHRSYYGCTGCGEKQNRLDRDWEINPGEVSPVMGRLLAIAGVDIAFERARRKIKEFLMVEVSDNTIRKQTQWMGKKQAEMEAEWIRDSRDEKWLQDRERRIESVPKRLYGSIDGAQVPIGEKWRELKTVSWYRVGSVYGQEKHKAQEITYHTDITPAQDFGHLLWATGVRRLADKAEELIFICDGAAWIWKLVSHYFPKAIQIVDWYHACEYLAPIADAAFSQDRKREKWLQKVKDWLWYGKIKKVIRACRRYAQSSEAAQSAVTYFTNNQHRMDYAAYRKKGYWIGSGTVESACKQIAMARLKIAGARWTLSGAIETAKARAAWLSDGDGFHTLSHFSLTP